MEVVSVKRGAVAFVVFLVVFLVTATLPIYFQYTTVDIKSGQISTPVGPIGLAYVSPKFEARKDIVFIVVHGWSGSNFFVRPLAIEIAKMGFKVLLMDHMGHCGSENFLMLRLQLKDIRKMCVDAMEKSFFYMQLVISEARRFVGNNSAKIIIVGHSLGGALAIMWGFQSRDVELVFALGPVPTYEYVNASMPKRLIVIMGKWDQVFTLEEEMELLRRAGWAEPRVDEYFETNGTVRGLYMVKWAGHLWEPYSKETVEIIREWTKKVAGPVREAPINIMIHSICGIVISPIMGAFAIATLPRILARRLGTERRNFSEIFGSPLPQMEGARRLVFALIMGLGLYTEIFASLGFSFIPVFPATFLRLALVPLFFILLLVGNLIWEAIFRKLLPRPLAKRGKPALYLSVGASMGVRYILIALPFLLLAVYAERMGFGSVSILRGLMMLFMIIGAIGTLLMEIAAITTYLYTEDIKASAFANTLPWAVIGASALPLMLIV